MVRLDKYFFTILIIGITGLAEIEEMTLFLSFSCRNETL